MDDEHETKAQLIVKLAELREKSRKRMLVYCAVKSLPVLLGIADREGVLKAALSTPPGKSWAW